MKGQKLNRSWVKDSTLPDHTGWAATEKGYINGTDTLEWMKYFESKTR